jgi:phosphoglycerate kinase
MSDLASFGDVRGKRVLVRSDLNVPLDGTTITDDGRIRASVPTIKACPRRAHASSCAPTSGGPRVPRRTVLPAPVAGGSVSCSGRCRLRRPTPSAPRRAMAVDARWPTATSPCSRTSASTRGRRAKVDEERRPSSPTPSPALADAYVSDGFGVVHRKQASVYDVAPGCRPPWVAGRQGGRRPARLTVDPERPYAVVLGGAKVADKLAVIDNLLGTADRSSSAAACSSPSSRPRATRSARACSTPTSVDACAWLPARRRGARRRDRPARRRRRGASSPPTRETARRGADAIPADMMGLDIGPSRARLYAEKLADTRTVFWNGPMGAFEMAPFAAGTQAVAQALVDATKPGCGHRGRRRRLRRRGAPARLRRRTVRPHLHRWWRLPGVPRGQGTPGPRRVTRRTTDDLRPHPAHGGQLEDEPRPPPGHAPRAEARLDAARRQARLRRRRGRRAAHRSPTCAAVQTLVDGDRLELKYGAQDLSVHDAGAYTGEISGAFLAKLGCTYVASGTASVASTTTRPTPSSTRRPRRPTGTAHADLLLRRGPGDPSGRHPRRARARPGRGRAGRPDRRAGAASSSPTSPSGPSAPARSPPRGRAGGLRGDPQPLAELYGGTSPTASGSSTAAR